MNIRKNFRQKDSNSPCDVTISISVTVNLISLLLIQSLLAGNHELNQTGLINSSTDALSQIGTKFQFKRLNYIVV